MASVTICNHIIFWGSSSFVNSFCQSASASLYMEDLVRKALVDPTLSQQAALLHQRENLKKVDIASNKSIGPVMQQIMHSLQESSAVSHDFLFP